MGRKKKFGEESDFVSVRVPKSKRIQEILMNDEEILFNFHFV